jgi:DNA polymerase (family 10)
MLDKLAIARSLREIASLLALKAEGNPWKARAYENGARAIEDIGADELVKLVEAKRLTEIRGIGEALEAVIAELIGTGTCKLLDELRAELPTGVLELAQLPNVGPKKAQALVRGLGVTTVAQLREACGDGRVASLKGFGKKTADKILDGIERWEKREQRILLVDALEVAEPLVSYLRQNAAVLHCELAGSARRWRESVADLDVVVGTTDSTAVMDHFVRFPRVAAVEARGDTKCTVRFGDGLSVDLRTVPPEDFATALHHFTGSSAHHVRLRARAKARGLTLSEWGLMNGDEKLPVASEEELYGRLELAWVPPELREDQGEFEEIERGGRFHDLVTLGDIRGMVHCHTTFSDGKNSVEEMARAADAMGLEYLTITDHSPSAYYAQGVGLDRLKAQWDEIARVQELVKVRLLRGTESDILADGALDYPDAILEMMQVVIASIHSRHQMDEDAMTRRIVNAMKQPVFKIWGHPLGRLVLKRDPVACRVEEILDAAAASRAAIEVNGDPHRLDLEPRWIREARKRNLKFVISTDAHSVRELSNLRFGIGNARRGGVRRGEVLNALSADEFARTVRPGN